MKHQSPSTDALRRPVTLLLAATLLACADTPRQLTAPPAPPAPPSSPRGDVTLGDVCAETGENIQTMFGWQPTQSGCATALASGFVDQSTTWEFFIPDDVRMQMHHGTPSHVWATYEVRLLGSGAYRQRLVRTDWVPGNVDVYVPPFKVHLLSSLPGLKIVAFLGGCGSTAGTPDECWSQSLQANRIHWEMRYCVDNRNDALWPRATWMDDCQDGEAAGYWQNRSPQAAITVTSIAGGTSTGGGSIGVSAAGSTDPEAQALTYAWRLVDASGAHVAMQSGVTATFANLAAGSYTVRLNVDDAGDGFDIEEHAVTVPSSNAAPNAVATVVGTQSATPYRNGSITVSAQGSTDPNGDALSYAWQLHRGGTLVGTASGSSVTFGGLAPATYTATVTATDPGNLSDSESATAAVVWEEPPTGTISGPSSIPANNSCRWTVQGSGGSPGYLYAWTRRDAGQTRFMKVATGDTYTGASSGASFTLRVNVTDAAGLTGQTAEFAVTVGGSGPYCLSEMEY